MNLNRQTTRPLDVPRSTRRDSVRALTSMPAGKMVPLAAIPLLREDACRGRMALTFEMQETAEILMNAVYVDVKAYLVPWLAFERFGGSMDIFNRSYKGQPPMVGEDPIGFIETASWTLNGIYKYLGLHAKSGTQVNTMIREAYNLIWNFRAQNRSPDIQKRLLTDGSLAPAFWRHQNFAHIVPDFDQAVIDGEVALNVVEGQLAVRGLGGATSLPVAGLAFDTSYMPVAKNAGGTVRDSMGVDITTTGSGTLDRYTTGAAADNHVSLRLQTLGGNSYPNVTSDLTDVYAELQQNGITVSLSNIELARKTQAFARIREQYAEHDEEWIIDMLMDGLSIPDQALKQPMLLAERTNVFGMNKRYSTDADALMVSAVNGFSTAELSIRVPKLSTGGVIMVTAEVTPEQLFERQKDPFFHLGSVEALPEFLRDTLDPEKVEVVTNDFVDIDHDTPNGTFGYAPLNHAWNRVHYNIGGKFYRPEVDGEFDEDRQRLWAVETQNPTLSADFYLCNSMHTKPFLDTEADPFEVVAVGDFIIDGITVFGGVLVEAMNNYDKVMEKAPTDRIEKE